MDADGGACQVEPVRHASGDVVLVVAQHHLEVADLLDQVGARHHMAVQVGAAVHAGEHTYGAWCTVGRIAGPLDAFPAQLQKDALLRVHQRSFFRVDTEKSCVEHLGIGNYATRLDVGRVCAHFGTHAGVQRGVVEKCNGLAASAEVVPELFDVGRAGKASSHADDGNRFQSAASALDTGSNDSG